MPEYSAGEARLKIVPDVKGFAEKLKADLKKIDQDFAIRVSADVAQARTDITRFRDLQRRNGIDVGVDVSLAEADAKMAAFRARQSRNIKIKVDGDASGALKQVEKLDKELSSIYETLGKGLKFSLSWAGIGELPAATLAITDAVGAIQQLSQAGLAIPGIMAGAVASIGTLAVGLDGVKEAYEAASKAANPTGSEQVAHTREVTAATNAQRNAVVDEATAERDRTRAVKDAKFALEDLNLQLRGSKISEQQAINNALRQRRDLQRDLMTGQIKDGLDLQQRLLGIQEADQGVAESRQRNIELADKAADANAKGIANSDQVVAANERVTRSQQGAAQASEALKDAIGKPFDAANDALGKLSPKANDFINTLVGMNGQFRDLGNTVQDNVFTGLSTDVKTLVDADLPTLKKGMGAVATAWNGTIKQLFSSLGSDSSRGLLDRILGDTAKAQDSFTKAIDPLVHGIGVLTAAGADALPRLADDLGNIADRFNAFITGADKTGDLSRWINDGITGFEKLGDTILNIGSVIAGVTRAAGGGDGFLTVLEQGSKRLSQLVNSEPTQNKLKKWFADGRQEIEQHIIPLLQKLPGFFEGLYNAGKGIADSVVPPLKLIGTLIEKYPDTIQAVVYAFGAWKTIAGVASLIDSIKTIRPILAAAGDGAKKFATAVGQTMDDAVTYVADHRQRMSSQTGLIAKDFEGVVGDKNRGIGKFAGALTALGAAGGPILALASVALPPLIRAMNDYTTSADQAAKNTKTLHDNQVALLDTLDKTTGALTRTSRQQFIKGAGDYSTTDGSGKKLSDQNALQAANQLKIPLDAYASAGVGDPQALKQVTDILIGNNLRPEFGANRDLAISLHKLGGAGLSEDDVFNAMLGKPDAVQNFVNKVEQAKSNPDWVRDPGQTDLSKLFGMLSPTGQAAVTAGGALYPKVAAIPGAFGSFGLQNQADYGAKHLTGSGQALLGVPDARIVTSDQGYAVYIPTLTDGQREKLDDEHTPASLQPDKTWMVQLPINSPLVYAAGGSTPAGPGPLPDGGYHAVVHPGEFMQSKPAVDFYGPRFMQALNARAIDPNMLPHYGDGWGVGPDGNPLTPGMLPGPSDQSQIVAPNPMGGGLMAVAGAFLSGMRGTQSNLTSLIPGQAQTGDMANPNPMLPGVWGLPGVFAMQQKIQELPEDQRSQYADPLQMWGMQSLGKIANIAGAGLASFGGALYKGVLDFFGLGNSVLSPTNSWFQAGAQSLGIFDKIAPALGLGVPGADGNLQIGSQTLAVGPNGQDQIQQPTFGTSVGAGGYAAGSPANPASRASLLGGAGVTYTPDFLLQHGIAPLYSRVTDDKGQSQPQIPQWANQLAGAFNLTATSHSDDTLHGGVKAPGDTINPNASWAFDFAGKPEDEQRFADFVQSHLSGQTLQAIWQNPTTGQQLGIAGGQLLGRDQYYTTKGGTYADHTDHVHWATDVAPFLWDPTTGKSLIPGLADMAPAAGTPKPWWTPGSTASSGLDLPGGAGGRGALLNLALAGRNRGGAASSQVPTGGGQAAVYQAMINAGFGPSEWAPLDQIISHESGWRIDAKNPTSGAFGWFQFLGHESDYPGGYSLDPGAQAAAGLAYIRSRYGSPSAAWDFWQKNHWYATGGSTPSRRGPLPGGGIPAVVHPDEFVQRKSAVDKYGVPFMEALNAGAINPNLLPHFLDGGLVDALIQPPPKPIPDAQTKTRGATPLPNAPVTQLPAALTPPASSGPAPGTASLVPASPAPPAEPTEPRKYYPGQAQIAPAPTELNHNLDAINTGISSGASAIGNIVSSAVSAAASAGSFGAGAAGASGALGSLAGGLVTEGGKVVQGIANVVSSSLVGSVPGTFGGNDRAFGQTMIPQQNYPQTPVSQRNYTLNGISDINALIDRLDLRDSIASQAEMAHHR